MKFKAEIDVMPLDALLDPQGKTVGSNMKNIGINTISGVRIGKHISLEVEANSEDDAQGLVDEACKKLLVNQVMEKYSFKLKSVV